MAIRLTLCISAALMMASAMAQVPTDTAMPSQADKAGTTAMADAEAIATLAAVNDHEIKSASMALDKKVSDAVMQYSKMIEQEHRKNQEQTTQLAQTAGVRPNETAKVEAMKAKTKKERDALAKLEGAQFEAAYIDAMVKDHQEALTKIDTELMPAAKNPAVQQHLKTTRMHIAKHLEQAKTLDSNSQAAR